MEISSLTLTTRPQELVAVAALIAQVGVGMMVHPYTTSSRVQIGELDLTPGRLTGTVAEVVVKCGCLIMAAAQIIYLVSHIISNAQRRCLA
jgi:hypothetical protein